MGNRKESVNGFMVREKEYVRKMIVGFSVAVNEEWLDNCITIMIVITAKGSL